MKRLQLWRIFPKFAPPIKYPHVAFPSTSATYISLEIINGCLKSQPEFMERFFKHIVLKSVFLIKLFQNSPQDPIRLLNSYSQSGSQTLKHIFVHFHNKFKTNRKKWVDHLLINETPILESIFFMHEVESFNRVLILCMISFAESLFFL